jgi:hypothetical protein
VFLLGQHEDGEDQFSGKYSLDKDTLSQTRAFSQRRPDVEVCWEKNGNEKRGEYTASNLCGEKQTCADRRDRLGKKESKGHCWIEQPTTDAEEDPYVDHQGESKNHRNVQEHIWIETGGFTSRCV